MAVRWTCHSLTPTTCFVNSQPSVLPPPGDMTPTPALPPRCIPLRWRCRRDGRYRRNTCFDSNYAYLLREVINLRWEEWLVKPLYCAMPYVSAVYVTSHACSWPCDMGDIVFRV